MFEIYKDNASEFRFRLKATNGENILASEGYTTKASCKNGIESVKKNAQNDENYELLESSNSKWYFNLKASNGQVIGKSQMYASQGNAKAGINSVKNNSQSEIKDLTE